MKKLLLPVFLLTASLAFGQRGQVRDKIHDDQEKKHGEPGMAQYNEWMQGKVLNAKVDPEYMFPLSLNMQITSYKKGQKKDVSNMKYFINLSNANLATSMADDKKSDEMLMVYAVKSNTMLMLDVKKKTGMAININAFMSGDAIAKREERMEKGEVKGDNNCRKTGKTKTIQGYLCEEYICEDKEDNRRTEMYISPKIPVNIAQANSRGPMAGYFRNVRGMNGMLMEANFYKNNVIESSMLVTEINESANMKVVMADYKMNGF